MLYNVCCQISMEMFTTASTLLFLIQFVKKKRNNTLPIFKKNQNINNAPISNLMTDLESLYNFVSEFIF